MTKELLQQALDALIVAREAVDFHSSGLYQISAAISAIKAQQEQPAPDLTQDPLHGARGYALLGTGNYCINHSAEFSSRLGAELVITLATDADKSGNRQIGESRDNTNDTPPIQADAMVIRIGFLNERGLFALEDQISKLRALHFPDSKAQQEQPAQKPDLWKTQFLTDVMTSAGLLMYGRTDKKLAQRIADGSARWRTELYASAPTQPALSDDEIWQFWCNRPEVPEGEDDSMEAEFVAACKRAIEAHCRGGNHG